MEFKYAILAYITVSATILIESQWNLNYEKTFKKYLTHLILIESQWNLNEDKEYQDIKRSIILIESQWNLNTSLCF